VFSIIKSICAFIISLFTKLIASRKSTIDIRERASTIRGDIKDLESNSKSIETAITGLSESNNKSIGTAEELDKQLERTLTLLENIRKRNAKNITKTEGGN
jgi:hypothetical protein